MKCKIGDIIVNEIAPNLFSLFRVKEITNNNIILTSRLTKLKPFIRYKKEWLLSELYKPKKVSIDELLDIIYLRLFSDNRDYKWAYEILVDKDLNNNQKERVMDFILEEA